MFSSVRNSRFIKLTAALAFACTAVSAPAAELISNGGFESGDFTSWAATTNGLSELTPWTVGGAGGGFFSSTSPLGGAFDAYNGFDGDGGLTYSLSQTVVIPSGVTATLTTNHRIVYDSLGIPSTLDRLFEITIRDLADTILATLYSQSVTMNGAGLTDLGWNAQSFDVSAFAGSTVKVHFGEFIPESFTGPANLELDDISLATAVPEPATFALVGLALLGIVATRRRKQS